VIYAAASAGYLLEHEGHSNQRHTMEQALMDAVQATVGQEGSSIGVTKHILQRGREEDN
jgi:hypothetical protein